MLIIKDERIAEKLQRIAEREQRPIEDILDVMLTNYPDRAASDTPTETATIQEYRAKLYAKARAYWQQTGDAARQQLTDAELDEQF